MPCSCELSISGALVHCLYQNWMQYHYSSIIIWAPSSEFVSSSIPSWQILTAHAQPFRGPRDLAFCLKVPLHSLLVWASSEGSGKTARMRRLAWTFAARMGDKYQIRLTQSISEKWAGHYKTAQIQISLHIYAVWPVFTACFNRPNEPPHDKTNKMTSVPCEDSDQAGHAPSLIRVFIVRMKKHWILTHWAHCKESDQTGWMPRLIWVFLGTQIILLVLSWGGSNEVLHVAVKTDQTASR